MFTGIRNAYLKAISFIFLIFGIILISPKTTKAGIFFDSKYDICLTTTDVNDVSSVWYKPVGYIVTECGTKDNPTSKKETVGTDGKPHQSKISLFFDENEIRNITDNDKYDPYDFKKHDFNKILSSFNKTETGDELSYVTDGTIKQRYQKAFDGTGPGMWLRFDCVMVVYHGQKVVTEKDIKEAKKAEQPENEETNPAGNETDPAEDDKIHYYTNLEDLNKNPKELIKAEFWPNPSCFDTFFTRYLYIGYKAPDAVEDIKSSEDGTEKDWLVWSHQDEDATNEMLANNPILNDGVKGYNEFTNVEYATGFKSYGDQYNLNQGIPTGETIVNQYKASPWYAETDICAKTKVSDEYKNKYADIKVIYYIVTYDKNPVTGKYDVPKPKDEWIKRYVSLSEVHDDLNSFEIEQEDELCYDRNDGWHEVANKDPGPVSLNDDENNTQFVEGDNEENKDKGYMGVAVSYQYLSNTSVYDFTGAEIYNNAFGSCTYDSETNTTVKATHYPVNTSYNEKYPEQNADTQGEIDELISSENSTKLGVDITNKEFYSGTDLSTVKDWNADSNRHINPTVFKRNENGEYEKDENGNLIPIGFYSWNDSRFTLSNVTDPSTLHELNTNDAVKQFTVPEIIDTQEKIEHYLYCTLCGYKRSVSSSSDHQCVYPEDTCENPSCPACPSHFGYNPDDPAIQKAIVHLDRFPEHPALGAELFDETPFEQSDFIINDPNLTEEEIAVQTEIIEENCRELIRQMWAGNKITIRKAIYNSTQTINDNLKIEGHSILIGDSQPQQGVYWIEDTSTDNIPLWSDCKNTAGTRKDWIYGEAYEDNMHTWYGCEKLSEIDPVNDGVEYGLKDNIVIPTYKPNGKYNTGIKVVYNRITRADNASWQCYASSFPRKVVTIERKNKDETVAATAKRIEWFEGSDYISCDTNSSNNQISTVSIKEPSGVKASKRTHLTDNTSETDPVWNVNMVGWNEATEGIINIHSPIVSPITIKTVDYYPGHPTNTSPNNASQQVTKPAQPLTTDDGKAPNGLTQLRLDEDYIIDWENKGNEPEHRPDPTPSDDPTVTPTPTPAPTEENSIPPAKNYGKNDAMKYEKYVDAKYVCFPFDVVYDGKFYEAKRDYPTENNKIQHYKYDKASKKWIADGAAWNIRADGKPHTEWIKIEKPSSWDIQAEPIIYHGGDIQYCGCHYFKDVKLVGTIEEDGHQIEQWSGICASCGVAHDGSYNGYPPHDYFNSPQNLNTDPDPKKNLWYDPNFACQGQKSGNASNFKHLTTKNHWRKTPFYIPSYALEIYGTDSSFIYCRVEANNIHDDIGIDHNEINEKGGNKQYAIENYYFDVDADGNIISATSYTGTFRYPCQLSGWLYDFTITGVSNTDIYSPKESIQDIVDSTKMAFCKYNWEKKPGVYNRLGGPKGTFLRNRSDGKEFILDGKNTNTLPLCSGKSNVWSKMGALPKGTKISFSFKTMSNLNNEGDYVTIKPTFRYISADNKQYTDKDGQLRIYYNAKDESSDGKPGKSIFVERASNPTSATNKIMPGEDNLRQSVRLADEEFDYSYYRGPTNLTPSGLWYTNPLGGQPAFTADYLGISEQEFMQKQNVLSPNNSSYYTLSSIRLDKNLRMFSGEFEDLKTNLNGEKRGEGAYATYGDIMPRTWGEYDPKTKKIITGYSGDMSVIHDYENSQFAKMKAAKPYDTTNQTKVYDFVRSMQTWFGQYYIPANLYIVTEDSMKRARDAGKVGIPERLEDFNLYTYMQQNGGVSEGDPVFEPNEGYLILNFDIRTFMKYNPSDDASNEKEIEKKDGNEQHLAYGNAGWSREGYNLVQDINGDGRTTDVEKLEYGDIAVIDLSKTSGDQYTSGIFNIN